MTFEDHISHWIMYCLSAGKRIYTPQIILYCWSLWVVKCLTSFYAAEFAWRPIVTQLLAFWSRVQKVYILIETSLVILMAVYSDITGWFFPSFKGLWHSHDAKLSYKPYNQKAFTIFQLRPATKESTVVIYSENLEYTVIVLYFGRLESSNI